MFSRVGEAAIKKDLTNTLALCEFIGNPHHKIKTIHVAGTNGKGSTSHMLAAILQSAGYKTGLYTSPHLRDFRERIRIDGSMIDENFVVKFVETIKPAINQVEPSFFEVTVAMAFQYFLNNQIDIAVIETGLGGRLDSTNIITPEVAVITNIGMDHMNILGNSIELIAYEKAGIIKDNIPVVIGESTEVTRPLFLQKATEKNAPIVFAQEDYHITAIRKNQSGMYIEVTAHRQEKAGYNLDLSGDYQQKNLLTVLATVDQIIKQGWKISRDDVTRGLSKVKSLTGLKGRWDIISENPLVVLDVGHNEDGIRQVLKQVSDTAFSHLHIVIGMVRDKEIDNILGLLPQNASYYFTQAQIPRALPAAELRDKAKKYSLSGDHFPNVNSAYTSAREVAATSDMILVCGSVFVVGEFDVPESELQVS